MKRSNFKWSSSYPLIFNLTEEPGLGINYLRAQENHISIKLSQHSLQLDIQQDLRLKLGGVVWDCALSLVEFIDLSPEIIRNQSVLELGAGTGVVGLTAALCGASRVTITDLAPLMDIQEKNIQHLIRQHPQLQCMRQDNLLTSSIYSWGARSDLSPREHTVILCSDCLYDPSVYSVFKQTLLQLSNSTTTIYISYKRRITSREELFLAELSSAFHIQVLSTSSICPFSFHSQVFLLRLNRV